MASGCRATATLLLLALLTSIIISSSKSIDHASNNLPSVVKKFINGGADGNGAGESSGTRWAVLVSGSSGYDNYRHQANVCHAYQLLKSGGLQEENIVVFMYDDIAYNPENPRPGIIINKPDGPNVYHGVPKDYNGGNANVENLFAVLLGNRSGIIGGSGKVLESGPNDNVFIYFTDHGAPGFVCMPNWENLYANDLLYVLKRMHSAQRYKSMVFYLEACDSGSMFDGLLPNNLNIYAVTSANPHEFSWSTYCPTDADQEYDVCLGDEFSVAWMEYSDNHDLRKDTLEELYKVVMKRTASSHVMHYGDVKLTDKFAVLYMGASHQYGQNNNSSGHVSMPGFVNQRDASLLHFHQKMRRPPEGSVEKAKAQRKLQDMIYHRTHEDQSISRIAKILFGDDRKATEVMELVRPLGQPLVDDWTCLKSFVSAYQKQCGPLSSYGMKYARVLANMCNARVNLEQMNTALTEACST